MAPGRRQGEVAILRCAGCQWSTELPLDRTADSTVIDCAHCGQPIYWHRCAGCGLCYLGSGREPCCPSCDDDALDELELG